MHRHTEDIGSRGQCLSPIYAILSSVRQERSFLLQLLLSTGGPAAGARLYLVDLEETEAVSARTGRALYEDARDRAEKIGVLMMADESGMVRGTTTARVLDVYVDSGGEEVLLRSVARLPATLVLKPAPRIRMFLRDDLQMPVGGIECHLLCKNDHIALPWRPLASKLSRVTDGEVVFRDLDIEAIWGGQESRIVADLHSDETYYVELGNRYSDESLTMILPPLGSLVVCCPELSQLQLLTSPRIGLSIGMNRVNQHSLRSVGIPEDGCVLFDPIVSDRKCYLSMQYSEGLVQDIGDPSGYTIGASERKHVDISLDPELWVLIRIKVIVPDHLDPRTPTPWSFTIAGGITRRGRCAFSSEETYALLLRRSDKEQAGRLAIDSVGTADIDLHSLTPALVVVPSGSGNH